MPIANIPLVLKKGILCKEQADRQKHKSIAMEKIQGKRDKIQVPGGLRLHQYANLYFNPRNSMMYRILRNRNELCVLVVDVSVLDLPDVAIADRNASSEYVSFCDSDHIKLLDFNKIYLRDWRSTKKWLYYEQKSKVCAEVLVPQKIDTEFIKSAFVVDMKAKMKLEKTGFTKSIKINPDMFFQQGKLI